MTPMPPDDRLGRLDAELALLAEIRRRLRRSEGADFRIPTRVVDAVLDERHRIAQLDCSRRD
ncbi:hypothetical protein A4U64_26645 (plasmid) [Rhodococcus sp. WB1]|uniref:hypothetical protein n=1 Tax=Rhodococcus sp. WB1 TaxID=1033922 RepID=UPI00081AADED|nr:hypothetical protein [Rhodococcus sp. WB1]ANZ28475.1 hypothetical protein A4U64_26645 [Rhodococcus sp. WB1]